MKWYMLYAYNIENGSRAILGVVNSPYKPSDRFPFYCNRPVFTKWIEAIDADIVSSGCKLEFRSNHHE